MLFIIQLNFFEFLVHIFYTCYTTVEHVHFLFSSVNTVLHTTRLSERKKLQTDIDKESSFFFPL